MRAPSKYRKEREPYSISMAPCYARIYSWTPRRGLAYAYVGCTKHAKHSLESQMIGFLFSIAENIFFVRHHTIDFVYN